MAKFFRFFLGILLVPVCIALTLSLVDLIKILEPSPDLFAMPMTCSLLAGFFLWVIIYYILPCPVRTYIIAHELTHALWATVMGADVSEIKIGKDGGHVSVSENNFLITLAPYFFPLYTVLIIIIYYGCSLFFDMYQYTLLWLGATGFTWGFHFTFTIATLMQHQPDIKLYGYIFSYMFIYLMNILLICLWIVMVSPIDIQQLITVLNANLINIMELLHKAWSLLTQISYIL